MNVRLLVRRLFRPARTVQAGLPVESSGDSARGYDALLAVAAGKGR